MGSIDEHIRRAVLNFHLHFVSNQDAKKIVKNGRE